MTIYNSKLWINDLNKIIGMLPELESIAGKSMLITGATGLICSSVIDVLIQYNETHDVPIHIFAAGRCYETIVERFGDFCKKEYFEYVPYDSTKGNNEINISADYIIHGASNAFPSRIVREPVETMLSNFTGMFHLLNYAKEHGSKRILYISSSEVYGYKESREPYKEGDYGFIDLLNFRNSYSEGKRATETLCVSFADEYGVDVVIARPGHIYGPTALPFDNRVSSAFAYAAARGENLVLKSDGSQIRSYCYCLDCASAIIKVLLLGNRICAYNISNPDSIISLKEMVRLLAEFGGVELLQQEATKEDRKGFSPMSNSALDSTRLQELNWTACFDVKTGLEHTVKILKDILRSEIRKNDLD